MGLEDWLLMGDLSYQASRRDRETHMREIRERLDAKRELDDSQDTKIEALRQECQELKLCLAAVLRLLVSRRLLGDAEVRTALREALAAAPHRPAAGDDNPAAGG